MDDDSADLEALRARAVNRPVLEYLGRGAAPGTPGSPYAIDRYVLRTHPDLGERLEELARGIPGDGPIGVFGYGALALDGVLYAVAMGTGSLLLRIRGDAIRTEIGADGGSVDAEPGEPWMAVSAWLSDVPRADGTARLRRWLAAAADEAGRPDA